MQFGKSTDEKTVSSLRVIVFEQDKANRFLLEKVLIKMGYAVDSFNHARGVLNQLAMNSQRYDLLVLNVCAPIEDDLKLVRDIRSLNNNHHATIPIVATTTAVLPDIKKHCQSEGVADVIMKPFDIGAFGKIIECSIRQPNKSGECHPPDGIFC